MQKHALLILLVQVGLILALSRIMGVLFARLRQPQVMGEMVAGIMLGPSLLGWAYPGLYEALFPERSLELLSLLSQLGVVFFLFLIGLDFDPALIRQRGRTALAVSTSSIAVPFVMGLGLASVLYPLFDPAMQRRFMPSALFIGAAISVTAFPVMARILTERNMHKTPVGVIAITSAAVNDVLAWCMLALVVAVAQAQDPRSGLLTALGAVIFIGVMLGLVRPFLRRLQLVYERQGQLSHNVVAIIFLLLLSSAYASEHIGIHALFGAFLLGSMMPKNARFVRHLSEKLEDFTVVFMLPVFFAYAGVNTNLRSLGYGGLWGYALLIIAVACLGKFAGAALPARLSGLSWRQSSAIGILMNTRGLMELVILTIGLELHVITPPIYSMMVMMAIVTTALTTPLLQWVYPQRRLIEESAPPTAPAGDALPVLVTVSLPRSGVPLLRLAEAISAPPGQAQVVALSLRTPVDRASFRSGLVEEPSDSLEPLLADAGARQVNVRPMTFVSLDIPGDIAAVAQSQRASLVLMGYHKPIVGATMLGGTVHRVLTTCPADVGILVDRGLHRIRQVLVPYLGSRHDELALKLANRLAHNTGAQITVLHVIPPGHDPAPHAAEVQSSVERIAGESHAPVPVCIRVVEHNSPVDAVLQAAAPFDLVMIGVAEEWGLESQLFGFRPERIARDTPTSLVIVRRHE